MGGKHTRTYHINSVKEFSEKEPSLSTESQVNSTDVVSFVTKNVLVGVDAWWMTLAACTLLALSLCTDSIATSVCFSSVGLSVLIDCCDRMVYNDFIEQ